MIHVSKIDTVKNLLLSLYKKFWITFWGLLSNSEKCLLYKRKLLELLFVHSLETQVQACLGH
jgi:hypothetical protein